jgi:2-oxoglutarate ferredoxin oxidoreductase subunit gamma
VQTDVVVAGFGGQGILVTGQLLAYAAMMEGLNVTFWPAYGAETRGGTVHASVVVADGEIGSPLVPAPEAAIIMNRPSLDRYEPQLAKDALLVFNSSLIDRTPQRHDLRVIPVPATELASTLGNVLVATLINLGSYIGATNVVGIDSLKAALRKVFDERRHHLIPLNERALDEGMAFYRRSLHPQ